MAPTGRERVLDAHVVLRIPSALKAKLERLAAKDRRDLSDYCRLVLEDHAARKRVK